MSQWGDRSGCRGDEWMRTSIPAHHGASTNQRGNKHSRNKSHSANSNTTSSSSSNNNNNNKVSRWYVALASTKSLFGDSESWKLKRGICGVLKNHEFSAQFYVAGPWLAVAKRSILPWRWEKNSRLSRSFQTRTWRSIDHVCKCKRQQQSVAATMRATAKNINIA